jgi:hypothetical protein
MSKMRVFNIYYYLGLGIEDSELEVAELLRELNEYKPLINFFINQNKTNSVALVRKRTIPIEQQPLAGEVNANFSR